MGDNDGKVAVADRTSETVSEVAAPRAQDRPSTPGLLEGFSTRPEPQPLADAAIAEAEAELAKTEQERDELPEKIRSAVLAADGKSAIALKKRSAELADEVAAARIRVLRLQIDHAEAAREDLVQRLPSLTGDAGRGRCRSEGGPGAPQPSIPDAAGHPEHGRTLWGPEPQANQAFG
jgi:hypothetical protein